MSEETTAVVVRDETALEVERQRFMPVMPTAIALERRKAIVDAFASLMKEGEDFGKIPGAGNKPTLMQPGAQKLDNLFGLVPRFTVDEREEDWTGELHGGEPFFRYLVRCQLFRGDFVMGEALGECNSWESKYRYRKSERLCPDCRAAAIIWTKKNNWWCAGFKGGCGKGFKKDDDRITSQETGRKANPEIFDQINTLLKMAQKRAHVGATINATSASEFFTQDVEDRAETTSPDDSGEAEGGTRDGLGSGSSAVGSNIANAPFARPIPKELQYGFEQIDKDVTQIAVEFKKMEEKLIKKGGANGVQAYSDIVKKFRAEFPRVDGKDTAKRQDIKNCLLDMWDALQTIERPQGFAATDSDLPF